MNVAIGNFYRLQLFDSKGNKVIGNKEDMVYEELAWRSHRIVNSDIEYIIGNTNNGNGVYDSGDIIIKEKHPIRSGLNLIRESTYVTEPLHYLPFNADYIGMCFVFADDSIDKNTLAFKSIYHDNLNITNGFEYQEERLFAVNKPLHYVGLQFEATYIESLNEHQRLPKWLMRLINKNDGQVLDQVNVPPAVRQQAWQLCQLPYTRQLSDVLRIESKAIDWLASIIDLNDTHDVINQHHAPNIAFSTAFDSAQLEKKFVLSACDIIHAEYAQPLTIKELAIRVGTNTSYLKYYFKQHTGLSIHEYLTQYRLKQAKNLLLQRPKLEVRVVAEMCGYQAGHFSQLFRERVGMTPSQYRLTQYF